MDTAGTKLSMLKFVAGLNKLKIGETYYSGHINVAVIEQNMLLGFDLLTRGLAILNMRKGTLMYEGREITMRMRDTEGQHRVGRFTVAQRFVVPP